METTRTRRTGRRPGNSGSREHILDAARTLFAARGYDAASIRGIAAEAGVDPALVMHFFGNKEGVFIAAMELPYAPSQVLPGLIAGDPDRTGERLVGFFVATWDGTATRSPLIAMIRSATSNEQAAGLLREFLERELFAPLSRAIGGDDAPLRATLVGAQMIGLVMARYVVRIEPLVSAPAEDLVAIVGPAVQRLLAAPVEST